MNKSRWSVLVMTASVLLGGLTAAAFADPVPTTSTGIPLDTAWKVKLWDYARANVRHPAWGLAHSERDYQLAASLADEEGVPLDRDALLAAALLHDLGGLDGFAQTGVDHAVRSAALAQPLLSGWGFPMEKWPTVKEIVVGHTYYGPEPVSAGAFAFRDADILDFLGALGAARLYGAVRDLKPANAPSDFVALLDRPTATLKSFLKSLPARLHSAAARKRAEPRVVELKAFLDAVDVESLGGNAL